MKTSYIIAIVLVAALIAIIVSMYGNSTEYATFSTAAQNQGKTYHVVGHLDRTKPQVYNELKAAYYELWDELSRQKFGIPYSDEMPIAQQKVIKGEIPFVISEAEPTSFGEE